MPPAYIFIGGPSDPWLERILKNPPRPEYKFPIWEINPQINQETSKMSITDKLTLKRYRIYIITDKRHFIHFENAYDKVDAKIKASAWLFPHEKLLSSDATLLDFEIWATQGHWPGVLVDNFATLNEALAYCADHEGEASYAIKKPDGSYYDWKKKS